MSAFGMGPSRHGRGLAARIAEEARALSADYGHDPDRSTWWIKLDIDGFPLLFLLDPDYPFSPVRVAGPADLPIIDELGACAVAPAAPEGWTFLPFITEALLPGDDLARAVACARLLLRGVTSRLLCRL